MVLEKSDVLVRTAVNSAEPAVLVSRDDKHAEDYLQVLESVRKRGQSVLASGVSLFHTASGTAIQDAFLASIPEACRRRYSCSCCKRFLRQYGDIVYVNDEGRLISMFWPSADELDNVPLTQKNTLWESVQAMRNAAEASAIVSPIYASSGVWGTKMSGGFDHIHIDVDHDHPALASCLLTPTQFAKKKVQDYETLRRALENFGPTVINRAVVLLESSLYNRHEKFHAIAVWLQDAHKDMASTKNERFRDNLIWRRVAKAPAGYATPTSTALGWMLNEIQDGSPEQKIRDGFNLLTHELAYMRPTTAPTQYKVDEATLLLANMGLASALRRRTAVLDDIPSEFIKWRPAKSAEAESKGVFAGLKTKVVSAKDEDLQVPGEKSISVRKFMKEIMPLAKKIEINIMGYEDFSGLTTQANPEAGPILKWDREDCRNPLLHYDISTLFGTKADRWGVVPGWVPVEAIMEGYFREYSSVPILSDSIRFVIESGTDKLASDSLPLFPECLRAELRDVRRVIEQFCRQSSLEIAPEGMGHQVVFITQGKSADVGRLLRVTGADGIVRQYNLATWD